MSRDRWATLVVVLVGLLVVTLVWAAPWRLVDLARPDGPDGSDGGRPVEQVVVRDDDNPAPRTRQAEQLEASQRGEREFVRGLKEAARAERADRVRRQRDRADRAP